jgi:hypothetical protein
MEQTIKNGRVVPMPLFPTKIMRKETLLRHGFVDADFTSRGAFMARVGQLDDIPLEEGDDLKKWIQITEGIKQGNQVRYKPGGHLRAVKDNRDIPVVAHTVLLILDGSAWVRS